MDRDDDDEYTSGGNEFCYIQSLMSDVHLEFGQREYKACTCVYHSGYAQRDRRVAHHQRRLMLKHHAQVNGIAGLQHGDPDKEKDLSLASWVTTQKAESTTVQSLICESGASKRKVVISKKRTYIQC